MRTIVMKHIKFRPVKLPQYIWAYACFSSLLGPRPAQKPQFLNPNICS